MKCAVHPEVDATGYCRNCGKPMCAVCVRPVKDVLYCEDCLAKTMGVASPAVAGATAAPQAGQFPPQPVSSLPAGPKSNSHAAVAFLLGFIPGLGAIYNGEYNKAIIHIVIFGSIILGLSSDLGDGMTGMLVFMLVAFVFYMAIDAMRTAKMRETGQPLNDPFESWSSRRPLGPIILIAVGGLFLLNNFGFFDFFRVRQIFLPLLLIGIGAVMLRNRVGGQG
jgi:TM2 domain-containing membrane protein YozV